MKFFTERNAKYDALTAAFAITLIYTASYSIGNGITNELYIAAPIVFTATCAYFYYEFNKKVKETK